VVDLGKRLSIFVEDEKNSASGLKKGREMKKRSQKWLGGGGLLFKGKEVHPSGNRPSHQRGRFNQGKRFGTSHALQFRKTLLVDLFVAEGGTSPLTKRYRGGAHGHRFWSRLVSLSGSMT